MRVNCEYVNLVMPTTETYVPLKPRHGGVGGGGRTWTKGKKGKDIGRGKRKLRKQKKGDNGTGERNNRRTERTTQEGNRRREEQNKKKMNEQQKKKENNTGGRKGNKRTE